MRYFLSIILILSLWGCQKNKELEEKITQLETEYKTLQEEASMKDAFIEEYTHTVNEINSNLENISEREGFLKQASRDIEQQDDAALKNRMLSNISSIDDYLKKNRARVDDLRKKLAASDLKTKALSDMIETLNQTVEAKEIEIVQLKEELAALNIRVAEAESTLVEKDALIARQAAELNTGYYIISTEKDLKEKGILVEKGGFLGIGKTTRLADGFDTSPFLLADVATTERIAIAANVKDVKIISSHHPDSYRLVAQDDAHGTLEILDPREFWKLRYLVIVTK
ncbi:MAG: hypothetical protein KDE62_09400 [Calditrichaeota bacterium]|nr:hypothetical protein [Calditrichota bacterium]